MTRFPGFRISHRRHERGLALSPVLPFSLSPARRRPGMLGAAFAALFLAAGALPAQAQLKVWTLARTERILREDPAGSGTEVRLSAARQEWESFQILVRSEAAVPGVTVLPGDLRGPGGAVLAAGEARLYRQHQLQLTDPTYLNKTFRPGWYPDALIPFEHPVTRQPLPEARFRAVPFDLPAGETHGFWVDLFAPENARPGIYRGTYRVRAGSGAEVPVSVSLTVRKFALPRSSTLQTALGSPAARLRDYYKKRAQAGKDAEPADWAAIEEQVADALSRNRISATPPVPLTPEAQADGSFRIPTAQIDALRQFVARYHVNAVSTLHPNRAVKDPEQERDRLFAWLKSFDEAARELNRPQVTFFTYLKDEPNDEEEYHYVQKWGRAVRAAKSVVKVMVVEQPWTQKAEWGDLFGAVDIWCPLFSLFTPESAAARQAEGETIWTYTALCQGKPTPWWHTDYPLLNYRVPAWISWRYRIRGLLYWGGMAYWSGVEDPWIDPKTLDRRKGKPDPLFNGEGSLLYPGRAVGYDGIVESLRVKALRDSIEDYEYLAMLERAGKAAAAEKIVLPLAGSWFEWEKNPAAFEKAREELAGLLE